VTAFKLMVVATVVIAAVSLGATAARGGDQPPLDVSTAWAPMQVPGSSPDVLCDPSGCGGGGGCSGSGHAGYLYPHLLTDGQSATAKIDDVFDYLNSTGHVAGFVGVGNNTQWSGHGDGSYYIQAGLVDGGGGLLAFIQYDLNGYVYTPYYAYASSGTNYTASVTRVSANAWKASINGHSYQITASMTHTDFDAEGTVSGSNECETMEFQFSSISPWTTSTMAPWQFSGPYYVTGITSYGFTSAGP